MGTVNLEIFLPILLHCAWIRSILYKMDPITVPCVGLFFFNLTIYYEYYSTSINKWLHASCKHIISSYTYIVLYLLFEVKHIWKSPERKSTVLDPIPKGVYVEEGEGPHTNNSNTYNSPHFWHYLPRNSIRAHILRIQSQFSHIHFRIQLQVQVVTCVFNSSYRSVRPPL